MTRQRRIILEETRKPGLHFSADQIFQVVRERIPNISLATVYRNLEVLAEAGLVTQFVTSDGLKRYDVGSQRHYHLHCVQCGRIWDLPANLFQDFDSVAQGTSGFRILGHVLEFEGICSKCASAGLEDKNETESRPLDESQLQILKNQ